MSDDTTTPELAAHAIEAAQAFVVGTCLRPVPFQFVTLLLESSFEHWLAHPEANRDSISAYRAARDGASPMPLVVIAHGRHLPDDAVRLLAHQTIAGRAAEEAAAAEEASRAGPPH